MRLPKEFKYYVEKGIIKKITPDKSRANFLIKSAELSFEGLLERVEKIPIDDKNASSIVKDCHDIIMELIRAKLLLNGHNASGYAAHEAEVSYTRELGFSDVEISFLNELRYLRNGIIYYGRIINQEYAQKVYNFLLKIKGKLK